MATHWKLSGDYYVDAISGNDENTGTSASPTKTIPAAIALAEAQAGGTYTIIIGPGTYTDRIVAASTSHYIHLRCDGQVIYDASNTNDSAFYAGYKYEVYNMIILNPTSLIHTNNSTRIPKFFNCYIKNCNWYGPLTLASAGVMLFKGCIFENVYTDFTIAASSYIRYHRYDSCVFVNSTPAGVQSSGYFNSGNNYNPTTTNCLFINTTTTPGKPVSYTNLNYPQYNNIYGHNVSVRSSTTIGNYIANRLVSGSGFMETLNVNSDYRYFGNLVATASINNTLSGSGILTPAMFTFPGTQDNKEYFQASQFSSLSNAYSGKGMATAYGYEKSSANPLHTDGGATWTNITTSSLGGFQIADSGEPTGIIESAVIDQGGVSLVKDIQFSWASEVPGATGLAVYTSSIDNQFPTRQTYAMRYGNSSNLSSKEYKVFEIGSPTFVDINGSGSGDQNFTTGSNQPVSSRYLQLKLTLRTNLTGSIE